MCHTAVQANSGIGHDVDVPCILGRLTGYVDPLKPATAVDRVLTAAELRRCSALRELHLEYNRLVTPLLDLTHATALESLQLYGNPLEYLPELAPAVGLRSLSLANVRILADMAYSRCARSFLRLLVLVASGDVSTCAVCACWQTWHSTSECMVGTVRSHSAWIAGAARSTYHRRAAVSLCSAWCCAWRKVRVTVHGIVCL